MDSIEYYNKYAAKVYEDTVDVDMSEIMGEFLKLLEEETPSWIWDAAPGETLSLCMRWDMM